MRGWRSIGLNGRQAIKTIYISEFLTERKIASHSQLLCSVISGDHDMLSFL